MSTTTDPVAVAFDGLTRALRAAALDAPLDSGREAAYLAAARRLADRWTSGAASPMRAAKAEEG